MIKKHSDISLLICDYNMPDGNGGDVYQHLLDTKNPLPYVFCSSDHKFDHEIFNEGESVIGEITKPYIYDGIQEIIKVYTEINKKSETSDSLVSVDGPYIVIGLELLLKISNLPCDIFIELKNKKILKILNKGETFLQQEFDKYKDRGIKCLIIEKTYAPLYIESICNEINDILLDKGKKSEMRVMDAHSVIMETVSEFGFSEPVIRATTRSVDFALDLFGKSKDFGGIKDHIFGHPGKYLTTHSIAVAFISVALLKETKWDSPETRQKLVLTSFLHDASISAPDMSEATLAETQKMYNFKDHPKESKAILSKLKYFPPDLDRILLEHHERPDGTGFPHRINGTKIHPLSAVFIFAHDVVDIIFQIKEDGGELNEESIQKLLSEDTYRYGNFQKCYDKFKLVKLFKLG